VVEVRPEARTSVVDVRPLRGDSLATRRCTRLATSRVIAQTEAPFTLTEDRRAEVAFLARYRGRTLDAYRHDLRALFQWAADRDLAPRTRAPDRKPVNAY
jgi:hypothetical protein